MWDPEAYGARTSFVSPIDDPGTAPDDDDLVCIAFNSAWVGPLLGAAAGLAQPHAWSVDSSLLPDLLGRVQRLIEIIGTAGGCQLIQYGSAPLTVLTGQVSASTAVVFDVPYSAAPIVGVASGDGQLHAWFADVTAEGFTANLDADVEEVEDESGSINWWAFGSR